MYKTIWKQAHNSERIILIFCLTDGRTADMMHIGTHDYTSQKYFVII